MDRPSDRRHEPRVRLRQVRLRLNDGVRYVRGNVSMSGVGFEIEECLPLGVGDRIQLGLTFVEDDEPLWVEAVIRHVQVSGQGRTFYVGASFQEVDELVANPLYRYVEEVLLQSVRPSATHPWMMPA